MERVLGVLAYVGTRRARFRRRLAGLAAEERHALLLPLVMEDPRVRRFVAPSCASWGSPPK